VTLAVIDDDKDVRTALVRLLNALDHEVAAFASAEAFEAAPVRADCLIVDVRLPGLSGVELRDRLRTRSGAMPIVLITGDGDRVDRDAKIAETPLLTKPFDIDALVTAIDAAVSAAKVERTHAR
jgi:FixJ family two-component response regulator